MRKILLETASLLEDRIDELAKTLSCEEGVVFSYG